MTLEISKVPYDSYDREIYMYYLTKRKPCLSQSGYLMSLTIFEWFIKSQSVWSQIQRNDDAYVPGLIISIFSDENRGLSVIYVHGLSNQIFR